MFYKFLSNNEHHNIIVFIFTALVYLSGDIDNRFPNKTEIWVKAIVTVTMIVLFKQLIEVNRLSFQVPIHIHV